MRRRARSGFSGFTLLELVVAASLAVIIIGAAGLFFGRSLIAWRKIQGRLQTLFVIEKGLDKLGMELRNGVVLADEPFVGASDNFVFASGPELGPLMQIRYRFLTQGQTLAFVREVQPFPPGTEEPQTTTVIPRLRSFLIQYSYQGTASPDQIVWKENWQPADMPGRLKVTLEAEDSQGGRYSTTREFWIPQGVYATLPQE